MALSDASVAQLVEHHVANVNVEGSNPFARSIFISATGRVKVEQNPLISMVFIGFHPFAFCVSLRHALNICA